MRHRPLATVVPRLLAVLALGAGVVACGRERPAAVADSTFGAPDAPVPTPAAAAAASGWEQGFGPVLFVDGGEPGVLGVVVPTVTDSTFADSTAWPIGSFGSAPAVDLFSRAGRVASVRLPPGAAIPMPVDDEACVSWPTVRPGDATLGAARWGVGFVQGAATAIPLDSIESMTRADSARLAADVARLASQIPNDTAVAFTGLPYVVRTAYRLRIAPDTQVLVADVMRRKGVEADPREQHIFLVAERLGDTAPWQLAWFTRASGSEDVVETRELLAAVQLGPRRVPALVVWIVFNEGSSYSLVLRTGAGTWAERWTSAYTGC